MRLAGDPHTAPGSALAGAREPVIRVRGLTKRFGAQVVCHALDLDVWRGEILAVVGASGTGKSVLLRCLAGLEPTQGGRIEIFGRDVATISQDEQLAVDARWGILFQDGALFGALSVLENIQVPMREHLALPADTMNELAYLKLALVGLPPQAAHKRPAELSGGMRKRAGLARALALDPEIVFLDEPTAGLDPIGAQDFDHLIRSLQRTLRLTVYMVTHDLDTIVAICDRVAVLAEGRIVRTGSPAELRRTPGHPWIRDYFCGPRGRAVAS
jgi:phospholipid/cholesterol/gamma-HCH transport system ATP-binding protein